MTTQATTLNASERNVVAMALLLAADQYDKDEQLMRSTAGAPSLNRLADQFKEQADTARRIAELLENAEYVEIGADREADQGDIY
jgi:hypothetical protein